jgi:hypothetical protein
MSRVSQATTPSCESRGFMSINVEILTFKVCIPLCVLNVLSNGAVNTTIILNKTNRYYLINICLFVQFVILNKTKRYCRINICLLVQYLMHK